MARKNILKAREERRQALRRDLRIVGIILAAALVIVAIMPRTTGLNYSYELGQPWRYGELISTEKFNIQMSDSDLVVQKDSMKRAFYPYFTIDSKMVGNVKESITALNADKELTLRLSHVIDTIYSHGVMAIHDYDSLTELGTEYIRMIGGNVAKAVPMDHVMTTHQAYKYIIDNPLFKGKTAEIGELNLNTLLADNLNYESQMSEAELQHMYDDIISSLGFVRVNEKIVDRGEIVTPEIYQKLKSYDAVIAGNSSIDVSLTSPLIWGQLAVVLLILGSIAYYCRIFRTDYLNSWRHLTLIYITVTLMSIFASLMVAHNFFHIYILPCCMVPIIVRVFADSRTAFFVHIACILIISLILNQPYDFLILQIAAGVVTIFCLRELTQRSQIIRTAILATLVYALLYTAYEFASGAETGDLDHRTYIYFAINGCLLTLAYPILWVVERVFGLISDVTLVELSNTNQPLLQRLSSEAPGTFQHSMQVSNLASAVAKRINAKTQLVRTGALYHDIGKLERPAFFTENQNGGNPHDHLTPQKSAEVITAHVNNGLTLAEHNGLPRQIKEFISTHHGLGTTKYFLVTYRNEHPDEAVDESLFRYPGPNPFTKEQAILMMADSIEAASRSLKEYTDETISQLVDRIIDTQVAEGYFKQCPITFRDIHQAKEAFNESLRTMFHTRVSYPELKKQKGETTDTQEP